MSAIEQRARELLAAEYKDRGMLVNAMNIEMGGQMYAAELAAIVAALTPPEGFVLVPVVPTEAMLEAGWDADEAVADVPTTWAAMLAARPEVKP